MNKIIVLALAIIAIPQVFSQTTKYNYSCGKEITKITWEQSNKDGLIYLVTTQDSEIQSYVMNSSYQTISWEYSNSKENTQIKTELKNGIYYIEGIVKSKRYSKTHKSKGKTWYQHIGFALGYLVKDKSSIAFECIRPDNLKLYEMQADVKETITNDNIKKLRINTHLTGMLAKYFGSDYYINIENNQFVRYEGVHGAPGTPKTIITLEQ